MALGFLAHGYATHEFEVTEDRLGVYLPVSFYIPFLTFLLSTNLCFQLFYYMRHFNLYTSHVNGCYRLNTSTTRKVMVKDRTHGNTTQDFADPST